MTSTERTLWCILREERQACVSAGASLLATVKTPAAEMNVIRKRLKAAEENHEERQAI
jgi:hypothetical protein